MKANFFWIFAIILIVFTILYFFRPKYNEYAIYKSPNNKYVMKIFVKKNTYHLSLTSEADYKKAYAVLEDNNGKVIYNPPFYNRQTFLLGDLNIEWDFTENKVYYTKFDFLSLD
ncbi:hypothetical protein MQX03_18535 [Chryseobacterium aahli]|uniref:hypothetical protein n=1 Tax=Chryseobacterium aahli TaxID=1278643 RepID=UPI001F60A70F|nr:hypothetical protein [Chryseobacterium aahli]MCI3939175.1 hypothetical protein [Chryseobacterium aahli]